MKRDTSVFKTTGQEMDDQEIAVMFSWSSLWLRRVKDLALSYPIPVGSAVTEQRTCTESTDKDQK
jgi:hypothetical protein